MILAASLICCRVSLLDGDVDGGFHAGGGVLDSKGHHAWGFTGLANDYQLAVEEAHLGLSEGLQRGGIAVAGGLVGASTCHTEFKPVGGIGAQGAVLIDKAHRNVGQVVAVGLDGLALGFQQQALGLACCADNLLTGFVAVLVIYNNF